MDNIQNSKKIDVIKDRCKTIAEIINNIREIYRNSNENQKSFIKTIIGASIWYLPKPKDYWSGYISEKAIIQYKEKRKSKISEEHVIPRKIAAKKLLEIDKLLTAEYVEEIYLKKYCKLHYITPEENKKAIKYQKENVYDEDNPDEVYINAGIKLIKIDEQILKKIKECNIEVIDKILKNHNCT
jgi:hypothetical protein